MINERQDEMPEFDFSKAERGKLYRPGMTVTIPVRARLGQASLSFLAAKAEKKGVRLEDLVTSILEKEIALLRELE